MSTICSPFKLTPPPAKKGRPSIDWQRCIICQVFTTERLCIPTTKGRSTFISAVNKRKDEVYRKFVDEYTPVENAPFGNTKYHKSCYKTFTSKKTCQHVPTLNPHVRLQHHAIRIHHQMKIISLLWHDLELPKSIGQLAYFANTKPLNTTDKCTKFRRKIEPKVLSVLRNKYQTVKWSLKWRLKTLPTENALYHSACITRYLLRNIKTPWRGW
jgi:hypothetical protein